MASGVISICAVNVCEAEIQPTANTTIKYLTLLAEHETEIGLSLGLIY